MKLVWITDSFKILLILIIQFQLIELRCKEKVKHMQVNNTNLILNNYWLNIKKTYSPVSCLTPSVSEIIVDNFYFGSFIHNASKVNM